MEDIQPYKKENKEKRKKIISLIFFLSIFISSIFITTRAHKDTGRFNWYSEINGDRAGYYIYLPSLFFYGFDSRRCPDDIDLKAGHGFYLERRQNKIRTGYFYGVALLTSPAFATAHVISKIKGLDEDTGFSPLYHAAVRYSAVIYLLLGLFFLKKFLKFYFSEGLQYFILLVVFLGTNLFFYSLGDGLMSHLYTFFALSLLLYSLKVFLHDEKRYAYFIILSISFGLLLALRITNVVFLLVFLFLDVTTMTEFRHRIRILLKMKYLIPAFLIITVFVIPQLLYWKYINGGYFTFSYGERFSNWSHPRILEVAFAPLNGLFLYSPVVLLFIAGMVMMIWKKIPNGWFISAMFVMILYEVAAYKYWYYGCGFGHRAFIDYYPLFCLPFGLLTQKVISRRNLFIRDTFFIFVIILSLVNLCMAYSAMNKQISKCFFGSTWDWGLYVDDLNKSGLYEPGPEIINYKNDFENQALWEGNKVADYCTHSGTFSASVTPDQGTFIIVRRTLSEIWGCRNRIVEVKIWTTPVNKFSSDAYLVCQVEKGNKIFYWDEQKIIFNQQKPLKWTKTEKTFHFPVNLPIDTELNLYIWNPDRSRFLVDDISVRF